MKRSFFIPILFMLVIAGLLLSPAVVEAAGLFQEGDTGHPFGMTDVQWYVFGAVLIVVPFVAWILMNRKKE